MTQIETDTVVAPHASLSLEEKVALLTGDTTWTTAPSAALHLRSLVMSDGPAGVRGDGSLPAVSLPSPTALAATWDPAWADRLGTVFAAEARRLGIDVVLAPVLNLHRTPLGGRHFENYSEDPYLVGELGVAFVRAVQRYGVAACPKHLAANDSETDRTSYVARIDERTLREVYLAPFEAVVTRGDAWMIMAAYNGIDDGLESAPASEHHRLLSRILKQEWEFDGVVVSDWAAAASTVPTARAGLDLVMPGPDGPWGRALVHAVRDGQVPEALIDDKVERLLRLADRVGARAASPATAPTADATEASRHLAARSMVVLRRGGALAQPFRGTVALIGPNAVHPYVQGGGSGSVPLTHVVSPAEGLRAALGDDVEIVTALGCTALRRAPLLDPGRTSDPATGVTGVRVRTLDAGGAVLTDGLEARTDWRWHLGFPEATAAVEWTTDVTLTGPGRHELSVGSVGHHDVWVDGIRVHHARDDDGSRAVLDSSVNAPDGHTAAFDIDRPRTLSVRVVAQVTDAGPYGRLTSMTIRHRPPSPTTEQELRTAEETAAACDRVILIVGTNGEVESEGWDRTGLELPAPQDELVRRVAAANPNVTVVVNAGAPVLLPWLDEVNSVLWAWLPGQEFGHALADVLTGRVEPAGRLPWTLPARTADVPVLDATPRDGIVDYREGADVGYLGWQRRGRRPARPFGYGLGWTTWRYRDLAVRRGEDGGLLVEATVHNTGERTGTEVVQVYLERPDDPGLRRLAGFATVHVPASDATHVVIEVPRRALERWRDGGWQFTAGRYRVLVGRSVADVQLSAEHDITS